MVKGTDTLRRSIAGLVLLAMTIVGCQAAPSTAPAPSSVTLHAGDNGRLELAAGRYRVTWSAAGCTYLSLEWAPASGAIVPVPSPALPAGSATLELAAGSGYVNRSSDCDAEVTFSPAG